MPSDTPFSSAAGFFLPMAPIAVGVVVVVVVGAANYTNVATLKWRRHFTRFECEIYNINWSQSSPTLVPSQP